MHNKSSIIGKYTQMKKIAPSRNTEIVVALYDTMIKYVIQIEQAIQNNEFDTVYNLTEKTIKIIESLRTILDFKKAQEMSQILDNFYNELYIKVIELNNSSENISERAKNAQKIKKELKDMRKIWHEIDQKTISGQIMK